MRSKLVKMRKGHRPDHVTRQSKTIIRDRTRAKIEANKSEIANLFRKAVKAKCEQWDADKAIEKLLDVELELADTIDHFAAGIDNAEDALTIDADEAVKAVIENVTSAGEDE